MNAALRSTLHMITLIVRNDKNTLNDQRTTSSNLLSKSSGSDLLGKIGKYAPPPHRAAAPINLIHSVQISDSAAPHVRSSHVAKKLPRNSYKLLDLFCGEGLASWGYWLSGRFSEIVGVDIESEHRSRYSFDFIHADVMKLDYEFLLQFDFIHASPPCQYYSKATPDRSKHPRLIPGTHHMLFATGKPYVIENVEGSGHDLRPNMVMNGLGVGLPSDRVRYFHVSTLAAPQRLIGRQGEVIRVHGGLASRNDLIRAMGLEMISRHRLKNLTMAGMEQGIPPAFTKHIAETVIDQKVGIA